MDDKIELCEEQKRFKIAYTIANKTFCILGVILLVCLVGGFISCNMYFSDLDPAHLTMFGAFFFVGSFVLVIAMISQAAASSFDHTIHELQREINRPPNLSKIAAKSPETGFLGLPFSLGK